MSSTEECSFMNESHVSFVRKCTLPGSLLQSGGGAGGAGFWGLDQSIKIPTLDNVSYYNTSVSSI